MNSSLNLNSSNFMIDGWIQPSATAATGSTIIGNSTGGGGSGFSLDMSRTDAGKVELSFGQNYQQLVIADGAAGYWRLNESSGTSIVDVTGNGNAGTAVNTPTKGIAGIPLGATNTAFQFDGSTQFIKIPNNANINKAGDQTLEVWVKTSSSSTAEILSTWDGTNGAQILSFLGVANCWSDNGGGLLASTVSINEGDWHQIVCVWSGTTNYIYVDGWLSASKTASIHASTRDSQIGSQCAGASSTTCTQYFNGFIDEAAIFPTALSAAQIKQHFVAGLAGLATTNTYPNIVAADNPISYWRLDEASGTAIADSRGVNNGTAVGSLTVGDSTAITDDQGKSITLSNSTQHVTAGTTSIPVGAAARTVEAWIKPTGNGGAVFSENAGSGQSFIPELVNLSGTWYIFTDAVNNGNNLTITGTQLPTLNEWSFYTFVYDGSGGWKYYLNGSLIKSGSFAVSINTGTLNSVRIGNRSDFPTYFFAGSLDEVAVYPTALTATQIRSHFVAGASRFGGSCQSASALTASTWYQFGINFDGTTARLALDGAETCSFETVRGIANPAGSILIGGATSSTGFWQGALGELRVYSSSSATPSVGFISTINSNFVATKPRYPK
jgi:hypothetical protein